MKFDFVIGTPPYEDNRTQTNSNKLKSVYYLFMNAAFNVASKVLYVTPARFLFNAGDTPEQGNTKMLNNPHFKVLRYEPNSALVFPQTDIAGGLHFVIMTSTKTSEKLNYLLKI